MIGELIQYILDKGFYVRYEYDPKAKYTFGNHLFHMRKYCGERVFEYRFCVDEGMISDLKAKDLLLGMVDHYMKEVNKEMIPARMIEEALNE